jgi:hypothetical protein
MSQFDSLLKKEVTRKEFLTLGTLVLASLFGIVGLLKELSSHATTPAASTEAEDGTVRSSAVVVSDSTASGAKAVQFSTVSSAYPYGAYGSYKPSTSTSGVPTGSNLIQYTDQFGPISGGFLKLKTPGITIEGYDIPAFVSIEAANISLKKCLIKGPAVLPGAAAYNLMACYTATNALIQDCTLAPQTPAVYIQGMQGQSFMAERCDVYNTVDGIDPLGPDVKIIACYIHDLAWYTVNSGHADGHTHNDCIQPGGGYFTAKYNNLQAFLSPTVGEGPTRPYDQANSVMLLADNTVTGLGTIIVSNNWMDGGVVSINGISAMNTSWANNVGHASFTFSDNIFGDNQNSSGSVFKFSTAAEQTAGNFTLTNNMFGATDKPLRSAGRNGTTIGSGNGIVYL